MALAQWDGDRNAKMRAALEPEAEGIRSAVDAVTSQSSSEVEMLDLLAPSDAVEEELRLQHEREEREKEEAPATVAPVLAKSSFDALETLLRQSEAYTAFLSEQMAGIEEQTELEAKAAAAKALSQKVPAKKTAGKKRGRGGKAVKDKEPEEPAQPEVSSLTPTQELLPSLHADLKPYQLKGVKWLISLYQNGINGILADQMGLGKTVQTIGFISHLRDKGMHGPYLVVGPLSTLPNWLSEFQRFLPSAPALLYHGKKEEREALQATRLKIPGVVPKDYPVIITSYEMILADGKFLSKIKFRYLVVDEGHRLKNTHCRLIKELRTLHADNRLLLTGTPIQNNLSELWSLLNFLMPEIFSSMADFESWFNFSSAGGQTKADQEILALEQRNKVVSKLHAILKPFVLRRLKSDVLLSLPRKLEVVLYANMTETQRTINKQLLDGSLMNEMVVKAVNEGLNASSISRLNNVLMQMRKNCNHPDLITSPYTADLDYPTPQQMVEQCGKMQLLERLLNKLHAAGHKMTRMLDLLGSYFEQLGHKACRLDGSVPWQERQRNIKEFNEEKDIWLFLLSTRAGGLGINLTAADTVIIYDSDWNPQQDLQAMDRVHRIGQTKPVLVFRLATGYSVEGKMLRRAANKMALERLVIKKGAFTQSEDAASTSLSATELLELLQGDYKMDDLPQSGVVSDQDLDQLLDRTHLEKDAATPYPSSGVGYELVQPVSSNSSILQDINS
ncbi:hypothetical protein QJQ45_012825 [Haematococcus lacustris]|nr:hypothetical protein QJQ45_012825 [Haematococcus lacustris]